MPASCAPLHKGNLPRNDAVKLHSGQSSSSAHPHEKPLSLSAALICIILVAIDLRPGIVSIGPLLPLLRETFGLSNAQASLLTAIPAILMGGLAFPTPWLATRFGRDNVILAALAILTLATLCRAFANSWIVLLLATAGIGAGIAVVGALIAGFVKKSFPRHTSLLMGVYAMSLGLGSTLAAGSAGPIATATASWRFSSGIFAIFGLTAIAAWLYISRREPATSLGDAPAPASVPHRRPWGYPAAWFAALYVATNNILFFGFIAWTATMYRELGVSNAQASTLLASFTIAFMIGNLTAGLISRNTDRRRVITVFAGLVLIGSVITAHVPLLMPYLFIPVIAFGIGGSFTLGMTLPLDHTATVGEANTWTAFVMGIGYSTGAIGPLIFGHARDLTGSFTAPLWVMGGVAVVMLSLAPFLKPDREAKAHP